MHQQININIDPEILQYTHCSVNNCPKKDECKRFRLSRKDDKVLRLYYILPPCIEVDGKFICEMFDNKEEEKNECKDF
jgi:hypothetical protein